MNISDKLSSLSIDSLGNIYISGYFQGIVDFDTSADTANLSSKYYDCIIAKYDTNGNYVYAKNLGDEYSISALHFTIDKVGNVEYVKSICVRNYNTVNSIVVDVFGNISITGSFIGKVDFDPSEKDYSLYSGNYHSAYMNDIRNIGYSGEYSKAFMAKYSSTGNLVWAGLAGYYNYFSLVSTKDAKTDSCGNIYVTGVFSQPTDFDTSPMTANLFPDNYNIYIAKYDAEGNYIYAKKIGCPGFCSIVSINIDTYSNIYIAGSFDKRIDFDPSKKTRNLYYGYFFRDFELL